MGLPLQLTICVHLTIVFSALTPCHEDDFAHLKIKQFRGRAQSACYICLEDTFSTDSPFLFEHGGYYYVGKRGSECPHIHGFVEQQFNGNDNSLGTWIEQTARRPILQTGNPPLGEFSIGIEHHPTGRRQKISWGTKDTFTNTLPSVYSNMGTHWITMAQKMGYKGQDPCGNKQYAMCEYDTLYSLYILNLGVVCHLFSKCSM